ncbi:ATP-grasp domain-containing protein [Bacteroides sp.]
MMAKITDKTIVVILGGNNLNSGIVDYCKRKDYNVVIVDWSPNTHLKGDLFLCIDVKDSQAIIKALEENGINKIYGAYSSIDLAVSSVNAINKHYGLDSMNAEALENALPKATMTRIWQENNLLNRYSHIFESISDEVYEYVSKMKMIFKPNISSSSRGITIIAKGTTKEEIDAAFDKAKTESFDKKVIIEEFVEGREFTCEMLGDKDGNVSVYAISVKYHTLNTRNNKIAIKLHYNSDFYPDSVYEKIAEVGKKCYKALGFKSSLGHLEILMKEDGTLSPVEIGARSSGFITNPLVSLASGQDFFGTYLSMLNGGKVSGVDYINGKDSSMYFFYDMPHNTKVVNPCSLVDFLPEGVESKYNNRSKLLEEGFEFNDINNDNERVGYEIITGERHLMSIHTIEEAERKFIKYNTGR